MAQEDALGKTRLFHSIAEARMIVGLIAADGDGDFMKLLHTLFKVEIDFKKQRSNMIVIFTGCKSATESIKLSCYTRNSSKVCPSILHRMDRQALQQSAKISHGRIIGRDPLIAGSI